MTNSYLKSISSNNVSGLKMKFEENNLDYELFMDEVEVQSMWQELVFKLYSKNLVLMKVLVEQELKTPKM